MITTHIHDPLATSEELINFSMHLTKKLILSENIKIPEYLMDEVMALDDSVKFNIFFQSEFDPATNEPISYYYLGVSN